MARIPNPLNLPEFTFRLAQYLDADDFAAFSLVSKSLYASFAPYLWQNIHLGYFSPLEKRNKRYHERLGRFITLAPDAANRHHQKGQPPREDEINQLLRRVAPWIRALSLHVHHFPRQSMLGDQCTHLNTLLITAPPFHKQFDETYWKACEALVQQNSKWLRSLTLVEWGERFGYPRYDFKPGHPLWTPLFTCAQHANLTSLRLRSGTLYVRHLEAFWTICEQLEILELTDMDMRVLLTGTDEKDKLSLLRKRLRDNKLKYSLLRGSTTTTTTTTPPIRFPKLRELTLARLELEPWKQMEDFVLQCPMLETLVWRLKAYYYFRMNEFCQRLAAQTWPHLDSLEITGQQNFISGQEHALLLLSTERPFKVLDLKINTVEEQAFVLLQAGGHFGTLTKMDLTLSPLTDEQLQNGGPSIINVIATQVSKWTITVFESCPLLEHIVATVIHARDIIDSKPWVCHRLKKFEAMINMDIIKQSSTQTTYTADDKRQCYQVFERLGLLRQLNVLNLNSPNLGRFRELKLVSLPLELRMGLGHLSTLRDLEWIGYHGFQDIRMVDMEWMLQHWNRLRKITGEWIAMKLSKTFGNMPVRSYLIMEALRARKVEVPESWSTIDREVTEYMNRRRLAAVCDTDSSDSESEGERRTNS